MNEAQELFQQQLKKKEVAQMSFRIYPMLKQALDLWKQNNNSYPLSDAELYAYLTHEKLYNAYRSIFYEVRHGGKPAVGSIAYSYLQSFDVSIGRAYQVEQGNKVPIFVKVPQLIHDFCAYMVDALASNKSVNQMYFMLTEKILIKGLEKELDLLLDEDLQKKHAEQKKQTSIFN